MIKIKKILKFIIKKTKILNLFNFLSSIIYRFKTKGVYDLKSEYLLAQQKSNIFLKRVIQRKEIISKDIDLNNELNSTEIYNIPINKFVGFECNHFLSGEDPLVETSKQLIENPDLNIFESYIYKYMKSFQPKTLGKLYGLNKKNKLHRINSNKKFHPWIDKYPTGFRVGLFGPKDNSSILYRIIRIKNLINNIQKYGYLPSKDDVIEGYVLKNENDFRFLVTQGHHRVAVMSCLSLINKNQFQKVGVRCKPFYPSKKNVFNSEDVLNWPAFKSGFLIAEDAIEIFNKFF